MKRRETASVCLYDDPADVQRFLPFTQSRPIGELRYGAYLLRERLASEFGEVVAYLSHEHLGAFVEPGAPPVVRDAPHEGARWFLRAAFVPELGVEVAFDRSRGPCRLVSHDGEDIGCFLPAGVRWTSPFPASWPTAVVGGELLAGIWQIIGDLVPALAADCAVGTTRRRRARVPARCTALGEPGRLLVDEGAVIEPHVVFDTRNGPIWIQAKAEVRTFSRLAGPLVIGAGTRIVGGQIRESSIGPMCVVHGEVSNSVFLGYANKSHDGFLGHSIVGRWVNLGAGTITSNLKNTYGPVRLNLGAARVETGLSFLGSLIGDHVKAAIGTMLPTGCVIGTGANLFGNRRPDAFVPAFAWGTDEPDRRLACRMFLQTAERVLPRRGVACDAPMRAYLESLWTHCTGRPCD